MFDTSPQLDCAGRILRLDRARVMGIVNVTPDSFSDGGRFEDVDAAIAHDDITFLQLHVASTYGLDFPALQYKAGLEAFFDEVIVGCLAVVDYAHETIIL